MTTSPLSHPSDRSVRRLLDGRDFRSALSGVPAIASAARTTRGSWSRRYAKRLWVSDSLVVVVTVAIAASLPLFENDYSTAGLGISTGVDWVIPAMLVLGWFAALATHRTRDARIVGVGLTEYRRVVEASALMFGVVAITFQALGATASRGFYLFVLALGLVGLTLERRLWRGWLARQRLRGLYLSRALVVGSRDDVEYVIEQITRNPGAGYRVDGAAIDDAGATPVGTLLGRHSERVRVVAQLDDVALAAQTMDVDAVVVAGHPSRTGDFVKSLAWKLEESNAELVLASRLADVAGPRIHFRPVEGLPLVHVELPQFEGGKHVFKRGLDIVVSASALLVLLPALAIIAILVRRDSPGPALFSQTRVGRNGETFRMFKFRSMTVDAESRLDDLLALNEGAGALFKLRSDPRVTRVGRVIRKYSLDELPQLWNVLVGDMSLVGPRPPLQREVEAYENHVRRRLFIKPGLTGMWQVNGRSDLDWEEGVRLDLYYVENWSLTGDLVLLWRTVKVLLTSRGAY